MCLLTINDDSSFFIAPICFPLDELGDIVLFPHQEQLIEESRKGNTKRAVLDKNMVTPWSNGIVPYVKDPQIIGKCSSKHTVVMWLLLSYLLMLLSKVLDTPY